MAGVIAYLFSEFIICKYFSSECYIATNVTLSELSIPLAIVLLVTIICVFIYIQLFGLLYRSLTRHNLPKNIYSVIGISLILGGILQLIFSRYMFNNLFVTPEFIRAIILSIFIAALTYYIHRDFLREK